MTFLLDVNALLALGLEQHQFHERVGVWLRNSNACILATCSITELGFARVLTQTRAYGLSLIQARMILLRLRQGGTLSPRVLPDSHGVDQLPGWVKTSAQVTDGHLLRLARAHGAILATLDEKIPGVFLIPRLAV